LDDYLYRVTRVSLLYTTRQAAARSRSPRRSRGGPTGRRDFFCHAQAARVQSGCELKRARATEPRAVRHSVAYRVLGRCVRPAVELGCGSSLELDRQIPVPEPLHLLTAGQ
jgi:hypothetical protein